MSGKDVNQSKADQLVIAKLNQSNVLDKYETDDEDEVNETAKKRGLNKSVGDSAKALAKAMMNEDYTFITQSSTQADDIFNQKSADKRNSIPKLPSISATN